LKPNYLHNDLSMACGVEMQKTKMAISSKAEISAIYFALLQCGYDYYALEKDAGLISKLESYRTQQNPHQLSFFSKIKQNTCEVYPYWPRAAVLEEATFYLDNTCTGFTQFTQLQNRIMNAGNISPKEKDGDLWDWITQFPMALKDVLVSSPFLSYLSWERSWIAEQNEIFREDLKNLQTILQQCNALYGSPLDGIHVLLNPIKCAYSSDHYEHGGHLYFSLGWFRKESILHELLHPVIHPYVMRMRDEILHYQGCFPDIDESYRQDGSDAGRLNAAEEYLVRALTERAVCGALPNDLNQYIQDKMKEL